ncbi:DUF29 domain-containing protein [Siccirubricoccus sp. G192]|uniref:DUF29 domain-containing protein n=1 Tax=Siccirubricoccus sp. G192 TaxID=2849651 RepID=UPI001C2CAD71|nr:DUF29 domain-containing protein [Siccirubricoccus sp. G192]MBV1799543.1 DUF29 domain-containing protein [Siccirubricoccus sp. G192]
MSDPAALYERDFHAWTEDQAAMLRAWPEKLRPNALDIEHLAEEIEDLGSAQRNEVKSRLQQILVHLLKLRFHPDQQSRRHWQTETDEFRAAIEAVFEDSPSLRARRAELAGPVWARAARLFTRQFARDGHDAEAVRAWLSASDASYFDLDAEVLNADWFPPPPAG